MSTAIRPLDPPQRLLLGPGPSSVAPTVLAALAKSTIGHLDPAYLAIMDETSRMLRQAFQTKNELTLAISGTGSAGMEACVASLIEPGDEMIVAISGYFGGRMRDMATRHGATVHTIEVPWGETVPDQAIASALAEHPHTKVVGIVHAATSTGAHQPLAGISEFTHAADALLLVDAVTSLGGVELLVDDWQIDACFSGTQKCLSCPPGLSPVTFSPAAVEVLKNRSHPVRSWYLDVSLIASYWGGARAYHHTAPINMSYGLHEALRLLLEEGLEARIARHRRNHLALRAGLEALGLHYVSSAPLPTLNAVRVPDGVNDARIRQRLLEEFGIEIGAGLGPFAGQVWRIGLMGESSRRRHVVLVLAALGALLADEGLDVDPGAGATAANHAYGGGA